MVGPPQPALSQSIDLTDRDIATEFERAAQNPGASRREAVADVARKLNKKSREVYAAVERAKKSGL